MISVVRAFWRMAVVGVVALIAGIGCHSDIGLDTRTFECQSNQECLDGWHCSRVEKVCVEGSLQPSDAGDDVTDAFEPTDADTDPSDAIDAEDSTSSCAECSDAEVCDTQSGTCVGCLRDTHCGENQRCDTRLERQVCVADDVCVEKDDCDNEFQFCSKDNECLFQPCANVGDDCSPDVLRQGDDNLACVPTPNSEAPGVCVRECFVLNQRSTCGQGALCMRSAAQGLALNCVASECTAHDGCGSNSKCFLHASDFGECVPRGSLTEGENCSSTEPCEARLVCAGDPNSSLRVCRSTCEINSSSNPCGTGFECKPLTAATGVCAPAIDEDNCVSARVGQVCTDGSVCMHDPYSDNIANPSCTRWCRAGEQDCASGEICNTSLSAGVEDLGVCTPACDSGNEGDVCPHGYTCHERVCRWACTSDSDCSSLPSETNSLSQWICLDGYCS